MKKGIKRVLISISLLGTLALFGVGCTNSLGDKLEQWACSHEYGSTIVTAPTCTKDGLEKSTCTKCGKVETVVLEKTGHRNVKQVEGEPATCTSVGYTAYSYCMDCGETVVPKKEIPKANHTYEHVEAKAPTCQETGNSEGMRCTECGYVKEGCETLEKVAHDEKDIIPAIPATCGDGRTEGAKCSMCGIVTKASELIPGTGIHDYVAQEDVAATCTEEGHRNGEQCTVCYQWNPEVGEVIPKTAHTAGEDCTCTVCGGTAHYEVKTVERVDPNCEEVGHEAGSYCATCEEIISGLEEIPVTGHSLNEYCECTVCGDIVHTFNSAGECTGCGAEYSYNLDATFATKYLKYQDRGSYYEVTGIQTQFVDGVGYKYGESVIIVIPETYNGKPVKSIAPMAFANVDDNENGGVCIKKVYLYGCLSGLNVGYQAFTANDFLTDIYLSGTINFTDDNPYASYENTVAQLAQFRGNKNLSNVIIAEGTELKIVLSDGVESVSSSLQIFSEAGNRVVNVLGEEVEITLLGKTFPTISKGFFGGLATCKVLYSEGMTIPATSDNWLPKEGNGSSGTVIVEVGLPNVSNNILEGFSAPTAELGYYPESKLGRSYYFAEWTFCLPNAAAYVEKEDFTVNFVIVSADSYRKLGMGAERLFGENAVYTPYDTDLDPNSDWYITPGCSDIKLYLSKDTWSDGNLLCTVSMRAWEDFTVYHSGFFGTGEQDLEHPDTIRTSMDIVCIPYVYMDGEYYFAQVEGSDCFKSFKTIVSEYLAEHSSDLSEEVIADIKHDFGLDDDENAAA